MVGKTSTVQNSAKFWNQPNWTKILQHPRLRQAWRQGRCLWNEAKFDIVGRSIERCSSQDWAFKRKRKCGAFQRKRKWQCYCSQYLINNGRRTTNMLKTWSLCNIIFVILTCLHLTNFFGEEKFSAQTKCRMIRSCSKVLKPSIVIWRENLCAFESESYIGKKSLLYNFSCRLFLHKYSTIATHNCKLHARLYKAKDLLPTVKTRKIEMPKMILNTRVHILL